MIGGLVEKQRDGEIVEEIGVAVREQPEGEVLERVAVVLPRLRLREVLRELRIAQGAAGAPPQPVLHALPVEA